MNHRTTSNSRKARLGFLVATLFLFIAACGGGDEFVAGPGDLSHIHDLALDDDGTLLVASHLGLYRIEDLDTAKLIGTARHDLMSMTRLEGGDLIASGHPDLRGDEFRRDGLPPHFGLVASEDLGQTWTVTGGLGENDFHALVPTGDGIYAAEATTMSIWLLDPAGEWQQRGDLEASDLAVNPSDTQQQMATDFDDKLWVSNDAAASWRQLPDQPDLVEVEWLGDDVAYGIDPAGKIWSTSALDGEWGVITDGPAEPETFFVATSTNWWVTTHGGRIFSTDNAGASWTDVYIPPQE